LTDPSLRVTLGFDAPLTSETDGVRYVLTSVNSAEPRRNPQRADDLAETRRDKHRTVERLVETKNPCLAEHKRAHVAVAVREVRAKIRALKIASWLEVEAEDGSTELAEVRHVRLCLDEPALAAEAHLDGCYVIKTDLPAAVADT
jgi:hypothetical protein